MQPRKLTKAHFLAKANAAKKRMQAPNFAHLTWNGLQNSVAYYQRKYGIKIYIAGETDCGKAFIAAQKKQIEQEYARQIYDWEDENFRYAYFAVNHPDEFTHLCSLNWRVDHIYKQFCQQHRLTSLVDLPPELMLKLNVKLKPIANDVSEGSPKSLRELVVEKLSDCIEERNHKLDDEVELSLDEVLQEMQSIQKKLQPGEAVGYFDTHITKRLTPDVPLKHSEGFIITDKVIIEMVNYSNLEENEFVIESGIYHTSANEFLTEFNFDHPFRHPQGDFKGCGMFALMYLKELLKENAKQLKENCLMFVAKDLAVFIPSPQVLRYSQSSRFNDLMVAIVMSNKTTFQVRYYKESYQAISLKGLLEESGNQKLLAELPAFRARWFAGYKAMVPKRAEMDLSYNQLTRNHYLLFKSERVEQRVEEAKPAPRLMSGGCS